jgi:hypothetical protein
MRRKMVLLLGIAGVICLTSFELMEPSGQVVADDTGKGAAPKEAVKKDEAKPKEAKPAAAKPKAAEKKAAQPKAARVKAAPRKEPDTPLGELWNAAARALGGGKAGPLEMAQDAAAVQEFEQQFGQQFRQLYKTELHFLRVVCQPTKQEFEKISADGTTVLTTATRKLALAWREARQHGGGVFTAQRSDPRKLIADGLTKSVTARLSPEQAARYQKELEQRAAARKRALVLQTLAKLDKTLLLTAEQRDKFREILDKSVNDSWQQMQMVMYGDNYFPQLPEFKVLPLLNETQRAVWRGIPRQNIGFGFDLGIVPGINIEDEVWDDDRPAEKQKRADGQPTTKAEEKR